MTVEIGKTYRFNYPAAFTTLPEYTARAGSLVEVVGITEDYRNETHGDRMETVWRVRAADGWEGDAFDSELEAC